MENETVLNVMRKRGFELVRIDNTERGHCFHFLKGDGIIVDVYAGKRYELIYTNNEMIGLLTSGLLSNVLNDGLFEQIYIQFKESVKVLRSHFEGVIE